MNPDSNTVRLVGVETLEGAEEAATDLALTDVDAVRE